MFIAVSAPAQIFSGTL